MGHKCHERPFDPKLRKKKKFKKKFELKDPIRNLTKIRE
jgi:hypothetical protein